MVHALFSCEHSLINAMALLSQQYNCSFKLCAVRVNYLQLMPFLRIKTNTMADLRRINDTKFIWHLLFDCIKIPLVIYFIHC